MFYLSGLIMSQWREIVAIVTDGGLVGMRFAVPAFSGASLSDLHIMGELGKLFLLSPKLLLSRLEVGQSRM